MSYPIPPGMFDILPEDPKEPWRSSAAWQYVEGIMRKTAALYGFKEIRTPILERTELFMRSVGETSDIVSKEMYTFIDRGDRSLTMRPEGTVPVMRAFIENQLQQQSPVHKMYYIGPIFRYDRPQAGRYRQHHQFGVEAIGNGSPEQDVEVIDLAYSLCSRLGLNKLRIYINSIGDQETRDQFRNALRDYLRPHLGQLSADSQARFETNPLRILDSKDPKDKELTLHAPSILDCLNDVSKKHFEAVKTLLSVLKIPYEINSSLVRGLDYYNHTVFEIVSGDLGAQNSIAGGGRFDGLLKQLGGPDLPTVGFGMGIERLIQTMLKQSIEIPQSMGPDLFLIPLGLKARASCFEILHQLREQGIAVQMDFSERKLGKIMGYADQLKTRFVAVLGDNELASGQAELKEMITGNKRTVSIEHLATELRKA